MQERISGVQECRSDASLRSSDDSFDYEEQGERMQVCPEDTEGFVNVNCRGAPCGYPMKRATSIIGHPQGMPLQWAKAKRICKQHYRLNSYTTVTPELLKDSPKPHPFTAMLSISTKAPLGSCFTAKAERAGKAPLK